MSDASAAAGSTTRNAALVRFAATLSSAATLDELEHHFLAGFGALMAVRIHGFAAIDPVTMVTEHVAAANLSDVFVTRYEREARHRDPVLARALTSRTAAYNLALMSAEQWLRSPVYRLVYHLHGIHHLVHVPLLNGDTIVGNLHFAGGASRPAFSAGELRLAEELGRVIGGTIGRVRAQREVELDNQHAWAALKLSDTAVSVTGPGLPDLCLNDPARRLMSAVLGAEEHLHRLIARPDSRARFTRRVEVELIAGGTGVLHAHSVPAPPDGHSLVTVLELEREQSRVASRLLATLTPRESEVALLVVDGLGDREIAEHLTLSHHTVSQYVKRIYRKLDVSSRVALTRLLLGARGCTSRP